MIPEKTSMSDEEYIDEVRKALAGIDMGDVPDETIIQTKEMIVEPLITDRVDSNTTQDEFDRAAVMWGAELSFGAWMKFNRIRDADIEAFIDISSYQEDLRERTNMVLRDIGITRPSEIPHSTVTIKHDGKRRRIELADWPSEAIV